VITRRCIVLAGGAGLLVAHRLSLGQPAATIRRVGYLAFGSEATNAHLRTAFSQGMQDLGWLEGKNVEYRFVYADGDVHRLDALASELIGQQVSVILVGSGQSAHAAQQATKTLPIVLAGVGNAVGVGLVASLAKPGGNITGFTAQQDEVLGKLIGILHEISPGARRIAILLNEAIRCMPRTGPAPRALAPHWDSYRFGLLPARRRNSTPASSRWFDSERRPSWSRRTACTLPSARSCKN